MSRPIESPFRRTLIRFRRHRLAMVGIVVIVILVVASVIAWDAAAYAQNLPGGHRAPSADHWFGTDALGRDVFARTLVGGRISLLVGLVSVLFATTIGTTVGALAGYYRSLDFVIMRFVDVIMSFPIFILLLLAAAFVGPGVLNMMVIIGV